MKKCKNQISQLCKECWTFTFFCDTHGCHRCYNDKHNVKGLNPTDIISKRGKR